MKNTFVKTMTKTNKDIVKKTTKFAKKNPNTAVAIGATGAVATAGLAAVVVQKITKIMWRRAFMKNPLRPLPNTTTNPTTTPTTNPTTTPAAADDQQ